MPILAIQDQNLTQDLVSNIIIAAIIALLGFAGYWLRALAIKSEKTSDAIHSMALQISRVESTVSHQGNDNLKIWSSLNHNEDRIDRVENMINDTLRKYGLSLDLMNKMIEDGQIQEIRRILDSNSK